MDASRFVETCVAQASKRPTLRAGMRGTMVREWQTLLARQFNPDLKLTGVFDRDTQASTVAFQRKVGLRADGQVSTKTWAAAAVAACYAAAGAAGGAQPRAALGPSAKATARGQAATHGLSGGGHHHGGHHHGGGGFRGGGAYFAPSWGYPYLVDDYPPVLISTEDCPTRVRSECYKKYGSDASKMAGCVQAGYATCGVSGLGTFDVSTMTFSVIDRPSLVLGVVAGLVAGFVLFGGK